MDYLKDIIKRIKHKKVLKIDVGFGAILTIDIGDKFIYTDEKKRRGEWRFWTYSSVWRIDKKGKIDLGFEDDIKCIKQYLITSNFLFIEDIFIDFCNFYTEIYFNDDVVLKIFPVVSSGSEHWLIFTPDMNVFVAGPGNNYSFECNE